MISRKRALTNINELDEEYKKIRKELKEQKKRKQNNNFAKAILVLRKQKEWTQTDLANEIKKQRGEAVSKTYISCLEKGDALPSPALLKQLSKAFGCGYEFLKDFLESEKINKCKRKFNHKYEGK